MPNDGGTGRTNQKNRTRMAIIAACRALIQTGAIMTMPDVAQAALVSEATAYRYFPDLASLMNEALDGLWPSPAEALAPVAHSSDPVERIAFASKVFLQRVLAYHGAIRAMISVTITRPGFAPTRPGLRLAWIDYALAPVKNPLGENETFAQLKQDLAVILSPESLFTRIDLCGLSPDEAVSSTVRLAASVTATALHESPLSRGMESKPALM